MLHARIALDLLLSENIDEAELLAKQLEELNQERRKETQAAIANIHDELSETDLKAPLIITASTKISSGIIGLAASRLVEQHHRPAIVMQIDNETARGSCRSLPTFDVTALLSRHSDLFQNFGGHRAAAGFTLNRERIPELRKRLIEDASSILAPQDQIPVFEIEEELSLQKVDRRTIQWLGLLAPHGIGNPTPIFLAHNISIIESRTVGTDNEQLQLNLRDGTVTWRAIAFRKRRIART